MQNGVPLERLPDIVVGGQKRLFDATHSADWQHHAERICDGDLAQRAGEDVAMR